MNEVGAAGAFGWLAFGGLMEDVTDADFDVFLAESVEVGDAGVVDGC